MTRLFYSIDFKKKILARIEGGDSMNNTLTTDNAAKIFFLKSIISNSYIKRLKGEAFYALAC